MNWATSCKRCGGAFADPDLAVMENETDDASRAILSHFACFFGPGKSEGWFCGMAVLDSARSMELDVQVQLFGREMERRLEAKDKEWSHEFDVSPWPRVMQIILQQQERRSASAQ